MIGSLKVFITHPTKESFARKDKFSREFLILLDHFQYHLFGQEATINLILDCTHRGVVSLFL